MAPSGLFHLFLDHLGDDIALQVQRDGPKLVIDMFLEQAGGEAGSRRIYGIEMTDEDHRELAKVLNSCKAKVVLSGYDSPLYRELFASWRCLEFKTISHASGGKTKSRRREVLWLNFPAEEDAGSTC